VTPTPAPARTPPTPAADAGSPPVSSRAGAGPAAPADRAPAADDGAAGAAAGVRTVGVVGAGTMGHGIAQVFAQAGREVRLVDASAEALDRGVGAIARGLDRLARKGSLGEPPAEVLARVHAGGDLAALAGADLVVEAIVEDADAKLRLFAQLDRAAPDALLASNTSAIPITRLAGAVRRPDRVAGMHFMNPVPVMTLVEVVAGLRTSAATLETVAGLCRALGKTPVVVRDAPGFVSNRVLMPMINEAVACLAEGVADAEGIDAVMKLGMRHPMGPLELADLIGLDVCLAILEVLHRDLGEDRYRPAPLLRRMVAAGWLGRKSGRGFHVYAAEPPGAASAGGA
jgi:3-hydroxybutyryl-CoA dehydrogenase